MRVFGVFLTTTVNFSHSVWKLLCISVTVWLFWFIRISLFWFWCEGSTKAPIGGGDRNIGTNRALFCIGDADDCNIGVGIGPKGVNVAIFDVKGYRHIGHATSICTNPPADSAHLRRHLKWLAQPQHKFAISGDTSKQMQQQSPFFSRKKFIWWSVIFRQLFTDLSSLNGLLTLFKT